MQLIFHMTEFKTIDEDFQNVQYKVDSFSVGVSLEK